MKTQTIPLGRILNIPIGLDYSWFLIFILLTWSLAGSYYPGEFKNWPVAQYWILGAITAIMLFVSVLLHELGHSVVALRYKIPVRSITLFIFGGVAQIAAEPPTATAEFWIALAGPVVSFALAGIFDILQPLVTGFSPLLALAKYLAYINGTLGLFNLIPGFPLDGGRVFRAIVWGITHSFRRATLIAGWVGRVVAFGFILVGVYFMFSGNIISGLWIAFIGWFLESAANSQVQQQEVHDLLEGHQVSQAMSRDFTFIPSNTSLQQLADDYILGSGRRFFIVEENSQVMGILTLQSVQQVPRSEWLTTNVRQIMVPAGQMHWVRPETLIWDALEKMDQDGVNQLPVMVNGQVVGLLTRENVISLLRTLQKFKVKPLTN
jgi:Zn-dependent protease